jgi:hypothetical protein
MRLLNVSAVANFNRGEQLMSLPRCPYCGQSFRRSLYHPNQQVCSAPACQLKRRTAYHRKKLASDSLYREQCRDSQRKWREKNREYARDYSQRRRSLIVDGVRNRSAQLAALLTLAKNNVAYDLRACTASIWLVGPDLATAKNIAATAQLIVVHMKRQRGKGRKNISLSRHG